MFAAGNPLELRHLRSINGLYRMDGARKGDFGTNTTPTPVGYNLLNGTLVGSCTAIQQCSSRLDYTDVYPPMVKHANHEAEGRSRPPHEETLGLAVEQLQERRPDDAARRASRRFSSFAASFSPRRTGIRFEKVHWTFL